MSDAGDSIAFRGDESSNASTHMTDNRNNREKDQRQGGGNNGGSANGSGGSISRSSLAASRLLRTRGGPRTQAAKQLMERLVPSSRVEQQEPQPPPEGSLRARIKNRNRAPGGAFAKTMMNGKEKYVTKREGVQDAAPPPPPPPPPQNKADQDDDNFESITTATSEELNEARKLAIDEFARGTTYNSRYHALTRLMESHDDDEMSEASMPSILNRSEIFHENAAAAVMALLTPRQNAGDGSSYASQTLDEAGLRVTHSKKGLMITAETQKNVSAFRSPSRPSRGLGDSASNVSALSTSLDISYEGAVPQSPITNPILSVDAERALDNVKRRMLDPSKTLSDLLQAIVTPEDGTVMDRGFMVRRKNACGAIKVLAATASNRRTMCWTAGVLPALTSVLNDTGEEGLIEAFPSSRTRAEYFEARKRAVATLVNLSIPKENRIPIFHSPGLVQSVVCVINDDREESRQGACALIAYLCKTPENRLLMTQVPGLLGALGGVIDPPKPGDRHPIQQIKPPSKYHWPGSEESESSQDVEDSFSTDGRNTSVDSFDRYTLSDGSAVPDSGTFASGSEMSPLEIMPVNDKRDFHYDKDPNKFLHAARKNAFAALFHLVKEKDNAYAFARHETLMVTLVDITKIHDSPSHVHALKILANVTRHKANSKHIVFKIKIVVPALVNATNSPDAEGRQYAMYSLQNLSQDRFCRQEIANTKDLILSLCQRARQSPVGEEKTAAVSALKNLTDDPANLIPMSNTPECFATLMQIAHGADDEYLQYLACDALATLSHWLRKIATSGSAPAAQLSNKLYVPSLKVVTWSQWE